MSKRKQIREAVKVAIAIIIASLAFTVFISGLIGKIGGSA